MANERNLIPAQKGDVRNPNGRPLGSKNRATILREMAAFTMNGKSLDGQEIKATAEEFTMMALVRKAIEGDIMAIKEIQDTLYGKITDKKEINATVNMVEGLYNAVASKTDGLPE